MSNYRNLEVWKKSHSWTLDIYRITQAFPKSELFGLVSQMRRASASIGANIAEGCGRRGGDLNRFLSIAIGSSDELDYHLLLSRDLEHLSQEQYSVLQKHNAEIGRMLSGLKQTVAKRIALK